MQSSDRDRLDVAHALEQIVAWLRQNRESAGLSASALSALSRLDSVGSLRITELADVEQLTQPGMTTLINRLEDAGLAVREPDPRDGRAVRVTITPLGLERARQHRDARAARIVNRIEQLSAQDQAALVAALPALLEFSAIHQAPSGASNEVSV